MTSRIPTHPHRHRRPRIHPLRRPQRSRSPPPQPPPHRPPHQPDRPRRPRPPHHRHPHPTPIPQVTLTTLFSPEHGIFGVKDSTTIGPRDRPRHPPPRHLASTAPKTPTSAPSHDQLKDLDAVVIDLQDAGVRFYTYETVVGYFLEAAACETAHAHPLEIILLDRPNPIGGDAVQGPVSDTAPLLHQLHAAPRPPRPHPRRARPLHQRRTTVTCSPNITQRQRPLPRSPSSPCRTGTASEFFDHTGLPWINPTPNLRSPTEAILYPALGLLDTTNISVGRGTDHPFELFGAGATPATKDRARPAQPGSTAPTSPPTSPPATSPASPSPPPPSPSPTTPTTTPTTARPSPPSASPSPTATPSTPPSSASRSSPPSTTSTPPTSTSTKPPPSSPTPNTIRRPRPQRRPPHHRRQPGPPLSPPSAPAAPPTSSTAKIRPHPPKNPYLPGFLTRHIHTPVSHLRHNRNHGCINSAARSTAGRAATHAAHQLPPTTRRAQGQAPRHGRALPAGARVLRRGLPHPRHGPLQPRPRDRGRPSTPPRPPSTRWPTSSSPKSSPWPSTSASSSPSSRSTATSSASATSPPTSPSAPASMTRPARDRPPHRHPGDGREGRRHDPHRHPVPPRGRRQAGRVRPRHGRRGRRDEPRRPGRADRRSCSNTPLSASRPSTPSSSRATSSAPPTTPPTSPKTSSSGSAAPTSATNSPSPKPTDLRRPHLVVSHTCCHPLTWLSFCATRRIPVFALVLAHS